MNPIKRIEELKGEFTLIRRDFHKHPEIGHQEWETSRKVAQYLSKWGYEVHTGIAGTGVIGLLKHGNSSKRLSIRADMDALPIEEVNTFDHASICKGSMHACGHDGHMTMALFYEQFPTDCIIACHNWPELPEGKIGLNRQTIMASCNAFKIVIRGRGAHGAMPNNGIDPLFVAIQVANALQGVITRIKRPIDPAVLSICKLVAGETYNVIADTAEIEGTIRTFSEEVTDLIEKNMRKIAVQVASAFGATAKVNFIRQVPPVTNSPDCVSQIQAVATELFGKEAVLTQEPVMPSEDFGVFLKHCPGALFFIGNGNGQHRQAGHGPGPCALHNPSYDFNDTILPIGASIFARFAERYLS